MSEKQKSTPKDVFLHLFNIVTFYLSVIGFIALYIAYIDALFPDALNYYYSNVAGSVRWASSVLLISVPAFLITAWLLAKDIRAEPEKKNLSLRKWLIYFTLFIAAITVIIDLMVLIYRFLDGEFTLQFFLKVLVVLLIAGAVFGYYRWNLQRKGDSKTVRQVLVWSVAGVTLVSIIAGFFIIGTPAEQRDRKHDEHLISDLQNIQSQLIYYWQQKDALPEELPALEDSISGFTIPTDPAKGELYEYNKTGDLSFELCATFAMESEEEFSGPRHYSITPYDTYGGNWEHDAGRVCFDREIDPELYGDESVNGLKPVPVM